MHHLKDLPPYSLDQGVQLALVRGHEGPARARHLETWVEHARAQGAAAWYLSCDFDVAGPWAGLRDLFGDLYATIEGRRPELLLPYASELTLLMPKLRRKFTHLRLNLTEVALPEEKVRNYPMDRAFRTVHGLVDLVARWQEVVQLPAWVIACDHFPQAGALTRRFFQELMRRRAEDLNLTLLITTSDPEAELRQFSGPFTPVTVDLELPAEPLPARSPAEMAALAEELEERCADDRFELADNLPQLIHYWLHSDQPERARVWQGYAFGEYNHYGLYEDALRYSAAVLDHIDFIVANNDVFTRWNLVGSIANCYLAFGKPELALDIIFREGADKIDNHADRVRMCYVLALTYARFLQKPDLEKAEQYVHMGLEELEKAELDPTEKFFLKVFTLNGLAYIRHRQGRAEEAIELCQDGFALLQEKLPADKHVPHRSVLLYNLAQIYTMLADWDKAIEYYTGALTMDPNYSEYYNERGNVYLKLGRLDEAIADYHKAIELSGPYHEVWVNLGQAYKLLGRAEAAAEAYSKALDLAPDQVLSWLGRAQAREALGEADQALADYTAALALDPNQVQVLNNRASLYYEQGRLDAALQDLEQALSLDADNPEIHYNRAVALADCQRYPESIAEFQRFVALAPDADERAEVEQRIHALASRARGQAVEAAIA